MDQNEFEMLAVKVLCGEALPEEASRLESALAKESARRSEFAQMREALGALRSATTLAQALEAAEPALPEYRLEELRSTVRAQFQNKKPNTALDGSWFFSFRNALLSTLSMAALIGAVLICFWRPPDIQIGYEEGFVTRGAGHSLPWPQDSRLAFFPFQNEEKFENWIKTPLSSAIKAKIWIDQETDTLHILQRTDQGNVLYFKYPLAQDLQELQKQLQQAIDQTRSTS